MYHYADGDVSRGPVARDVLRGRITPQTLVWREGLPEWTSAGSLPELADLFANATPAPIAPQPPFAPPMQPPVQPATGNAPSFGPAYPPIPSSYNDRPGLAPIHYQQPHQMVAPTPGMATASMVLGIIGICLSCAWGVGLICSILALVFGYSARSNGAVGANPGAGQAVAGIVMGWVTIALGGLFWAGILIAIIAHA